MYLIFNKVITVRYKTDDIINDIEEILYTVFLYINATARYVRFVIWISYDGDF